MHYTRLHHRQNIRSCVSEQLIYQPFLCPHAHLPTRHRRTTPPWPFIAYKETDLQRVHPDHFAEARRCEVFFEKQDCPVRSEVDLDDVHG